MSQQAKRYRCQEAEQRPKLTKHHVPPRHPDRYLHTIKKDERHHRAYHLLFGAAPSLADCISILKRDWWTV